MMESPLFRFGFMTDNHLGSVLPGMAERTAAVFRLFRREKAELILDGGDITDSWQPENARLFRRMFLETWPTPENRPVFFSIAAGHDINDNPARTEAYGEFLHTIGAGNVNPFLEFHGFPFIGHSQFQDPAILESMLKKAEEEYPDKPVFVLTHAPAQGTVYRSEGPNCCPEYRRILDGHSRVIHLSGHVHTPVFFDRQIWQGSFTAVNGGSLTYWKDDPFGRESRGQNACDALLFHVYADRIRIFRFDGISGNECAPCWEFPLPMIPETAPYNPERRKISCPIPEFQSGETAEFQAESVPFVYGKLLLPKTAAENTVHRYRVRLCEQEKEIAVFDYFPVSGRPDTQTGKTAFDFPAGMLDGNKVYSATVTPMNIFNREGKSLFLAFHTPESALKTVPLSGVKLEFEGKRIPVTQEEFSFSTTCSTPFCRLVLPPETLALTGKNWGVSFDFACISHGRPAILMAAGARPFWGRHTFPEGEEPYHRHCFDFTPVFFPDKNRWFPENEFSVLLREGEPGEYRIRNIRCFTF